MNNQTRQWTIDPFHSNIEFKVKHMVIATTTGHFKNYEGTVETTGNDFANAKIRFVAKVDSIETGAADRNNHLKSDDFFNVAQFPDITFEGGNMEKISEEEYLLHGNLTMRDVTKAITLKVSYGGMVKDFYGNHRAGFEVSGSIRRKEFGLKWDAMTEMGGAVVSDEVRIACNVQFTTPIAVEAEASKA